MRQKNYEGSKIILFARFYRPHLRLFLFVLSCALLMAGIDLVYPLAMRYALNELLPNTMYNFFFALIGGLIVMYIVRSILSYIVTYWGHGLGARIETDMRSAIFGHLQQLSFRFYDNNRTGQLMSRVTSDLTDVTELAHHGPEDLLISFVTIVGAIVILWGINWQLALILMILVPITLLYTIAQRRRLERVSRRVKEKMAGINTDIESSISGVRVSKAFTNEDYEIEKFGRGNQRYLGARREFFRAVGVFHSGMEFFVNIFGVAIIGVGGLFIMGGSMNTVDVLTFSLYVATFLQPIRRLAAFVEQFSSGMAGFVRFTEIMRLKPEIEDAPGAVEIGRAKGDISFRDVTFSYDGRDKVLAHLDLEIRAGETVAVVGPSGGGKTTLCHLIPRFYETQSGTIALDGRDIKAITLESLRKNIGSVSQDVFLFSGTIRENIRYGRIDASDEEIIEAARRAEIYDAILEMPDGLDTQVGERGIRLSGGQKQRISIARIFLKNPPILILDEATSALDSVTEQKIQESFELLSQGRTTLIIAHRLSTIKRADEIIYIDEQGIRERGSHEALLAQDGEYAKLYRTQYGVE